MTTPSSNFSGKFAVLRADLTPGFKLCSKNEEPGDESHGLVNLEDDCDEDFDQKYLSQSSEKKPHFQPAEGQKH